MKNLKIIYSLFTIFIMLSCSDDFVNVDPQDPSSESFFNSEQDYQDALVAAYDYLQTTSKFVQFAEIASDNTLCGGESAIDSPYIQQIDDMIHSAVGQGMEDYGPCGNGCMKPSTVVIILWSFKTKQIFQIKQVSLLKRGF